MSQNGPVDPNLLCSKDQQKKKQKKKNQQKNKHKQKKMNTNKDSQIEKYKNHKQKKKNKNKNTHLKKEKKITKLVHIKIPVEKRIPTCENCNEKKSGWYCNICEAYLCVECEEKIHENSIFKKHKDQTKKVPSKELDNLLFKKNYKPPTTLDHYLLNENSDFLEYKNKTNEKNIFFSKKCLSGGIHEIEMQIHSFVTKDFMNQLKLGVINQKHFGKFKTKNELEDIYYLRIQQENEDSNYKFKAEKRVDNILIKKYFSGETISIYTINFQSNPIIMRLDMEKKKIIFKYGEKKVGKLSKIPKKVYVFVQLYEPRYFHNKLLFSHRDPVLLKK
ncbi:zinc finger protein constans-like [Anaeramoeba flamelloides]|uniref:Zinc finger protein constans-like n=1 Tax=Anaeramoeba flamelloides TaxID=1746091 RepID=A0AAV7ZAU6_9EUKA|nr:zinc finger protein constans-like [Anaeramoeba flamelloides]